MCEGFIRTRYICVLLRQEVEAQSTESGSLPECDAAMLKKLKASALAAIDALLMTDAPLLHPPGLVATAALRSAFKARLLR